MYVLPCVEHLTSALSNSTWAGTRLTEMKTGFLPSQGTTERHMLRVSETDVMVITADVCVGLIIAGSPTVALWDAHKL